MRSFILTALMVIFPVLAMATPPQIVGVREQPIGVNETHLFVLRILNDNLGRHQTTQTDVVLIARNRATNADDQHWPVMRVLDHGMDYAFEEFENRVDPVPFGKKVNPYAVLLWRNARPLLGREGLSVDESQIEVTQTDGYIEILDIWRERRFQLTYAEITELFTISLQATRTATPAYFIEGGERGEDMLGNVTFNPAIDCAFPEFLPIYEKDGEEFVTNWFVKVTCANDWTMASMSIYLQMSPTGPN